VPLLLFRVSIKGGGSTATFNKVVEVGIMLYVFYSKTWHKMLAETAYTSAFHRKKIYIFFK